MKKLIYMFLLIGVVAAPIDINRNVNIYEDAEIIEKYGSHLEGIDVENYKPTISESDLITETSNFDNSVINSSDINIKHLFSPINVLDNFEYNINDYQKLLNRDLSINLSGTIRASILDLTRNNTNYIENIFVEKNDDINKFREFKEELISYSDKELRIFGREIDGEYVNSETSQVYNNIIEIELD